MILDINQIGTLIKEPANADLIAKAVEKHRKLAMHVNGVGAENAIEQLTNVESEEERELRKRLVRSNRSLFSTMLRPFDKAFSAKGGSVFYDLPDVNAFTNYINEVNGVGLRTWLKKRWKNKFMTDPMGVILIEVNDGRPEPKYKAVTSIHDYAFKGISLEYIIFKPVKGDQLKKMFPDVEFEVKDDNEYFRMIDDEKDVYIEKVGEEVRMIEELLVQNPIGDVPATLCSDMYDNESTAMMSPIEDVVDLADEYLRDTSIHTIYKALHSYPVFWAFLPDCKFCDGTGKVEDLDVTNGFSTCSKCHGHGKDIRKDVSKIIGLDIPEPDEANITPPAGYIQTDVASWQQQREELDWLQRLMHFALWGTHTREQASNETATGRFLDSQPVNDRLDDFSGTIENIETFHTDFIGRMLYPKTYKGSSVGLGRRYIIESPDVLWVRYQEARKAGSPVATLDYLLTQFYESEFRSQPNQFAIYTKLMYVEPFIHLTSTEVEALSVSEDDKKKKFYFTEWLGEKEDAYILMTPIAKLREDLESYVAPKQNNTVQTKT